MTASVRRLNHAVLYVRDARRSAQFYSEALGFQVVAEYGDGAAVFMRAAETENHHDLGLFSIGAAAAPPQQGRVGLYHLAGRSRRFRISPRCESGSCEWARSSARAITA